MKRNVEVELHNAFKAAGAASGLNMTDVLLQFIQNYVGKSAPKKGQRQSREQERTESGAHSAADRTQPSHLNGHGTEDAQGSGESSAGSRTAPIYICVMKGPKKPAA